MIDKLANEFESVLEKEMPFIGFEDRRQITSTLKKLLEVKTYQHSAIFHLDKYLYETVSETDKAEMLAEGRYYNAHRIAESILENTRTEKLEENIDVEDYNGSKYKEHQLHSTVYVLKP